MPHYLIIFQHASFYSFRGTSSFNVSLILSPENRKFQVISERFIFQKKTLLKIDRVVESLLNNTDKRSHTVYEPSQKNDTVGIFRFYIGTVKIRQFEVDGSQLKVKHKLHKNLTNRKTDASGKNSSALFSS